MTALGALPADDVSGIEDLADVVRSVVPRDVVRARADGALDRDLWRRFGELGWLGLTVPEVDGGAGGDERAAAAVARELGAAGRAEPFAASGVIVPACLAGATGPASRELLERAMAGDVLVSPAWQDERGGLAQDVSSIAIDRLPVTARPAGDHLVLSGRAHWVPTAAADVFLVAALAGAEPVLAQVDRGAPGLRHEPLRMADGSSAATLHFDDLLLPAESVLSRGDDVVTVLAAAVDAGVVVTAAELLGATGRMLELTLDYLRDRRQFGRQIGSFQALQHKAVDMWVQLQLSEFAVDDALRTRATPGVGPAARTLAASSAKARTSAAALAVGAAAIQLHGAIGFTEEYELAHHVNRALVLASWLGNASAHARRYGHLTPSGTAGVGSEDGR
ncbi:acyl-CoA dehydrogenase [Pseudonocardia sp. KRD-184]|uniref:Acyl-CoA dehydrogenase n=1 Tax=Pseudonocardia oceani TaxID=2792013 RepID=A0ABS6U4B7_9PSEU|nr:acyl-CoA dehydrogenase [Pseudonocardia oceani]MBW0090708.1 acyl-CoA dehydrogenase [Pseudonocardia oceani]MBW0097604.1 acyl-CoA dehydrogenase [Pseudonocardia oceani]MBW0124327.1 acyl-CoA dehydrogenase [Pseudonocardia oceani]MBW0127073.1 acyl-CoA dehydrogenase [Pseudonocardia oceani]